MPIGYGNYSGDPGVVGQAAVAGRAAARSATPARATSKRSSPLNQGEPLYEQLTDTHRPHVLRLSGGWTAAVVLERGNWAMRHLLGGWQINTVTFFRSGVPVGMPDNVDLIGDPVLEQPDDGALVQYLHADRPPARGRAAPATREQPAFRIRAENALDTTGARLEGVMQRRAVQRGLLVLQERPRCTSRVNFQLRVEMFNATNVVQWGEPEHDRHQYGVRLGHGEPGQRSAVGAAAVPYQLPNDRVRWGWRRRPSPARPLLRCATRRQSTRSASTGMRNGRGAAVQLVGVDRFTEYGGASGTLECRFDEDPVD